MKNLNAALQWYDAQLRAIKAIRDWIQDGRPHATPVLSSIKPYLELNKKEALRELDRAREDLQRMALVRLFSGFEADFRLALAEYLKRACDASGTYGAAQRNLNDIETALAGPIESIVALFRALEPRFSGSDKGHLDKLRWFRNDLIHGGFDALAVEDDPRKVFALLQRILQTFPVRGER